MFAALNMLDGTVLGECMPSHRSREFVRFLKKIDAETPSGVDLHLIVDADMIVGSINRCKEALGTAH